MIRFFKGLLGVDRPRVSRNQVLGAQPVRNPAVSWERKVWREDGPSVVLLRVPRRSGRWSDFVARMFQIPDFKKVELDEMGSDVWEMCDGKADVDAITRVICDRFHLNRRQGESSVTAYMRMLAERRFLALRVEKVMAGKGAGRQSGDRQTGRVKKK